LAWSYGTISPSIQIVSERTLPVAKGLPLSQKLERELVQIDEGPVPER
jgi:hypothetical protein